MNLEAYLKQHYSPSSIGNYLYLIQHYCAQSPAPQKASYQDIMDYIATLRTSGKHPKTIRNHLFALKIYYRFLCDTGQRKDHPCQMLYLKDKINRAVDVQSLYSMPHMEQFLESYQPSPVNAPFLLREKAIIGLLIYQALTVLEITQLSTSDLNLDKGTLHIKASAKNNARSLDLNGAQVMLMHRYLRQVRPILLGNRPTNPALMISNSGKRMAPHGINRTINANRDALEKMQPLKIRQSVIAHLLRKGNDLRVVQVFAGHKRAAATEEYKQSGLEELKAIIDKLHPLQ
jgi:integrase/recombinase XerD